MPSPCRNSIRADYRPALCPENCRWQSNILSSWLRYYGHYNIVLPWLTLIVTLMAIALYFVFCFFGSTLSHVPCGKSGRPIWVRHSNHNNSTTDSYQCVQYFHVSKQRLPVLKRVLHWKLTEKNPLPYRGLQPESVLRLVFLPISRDLKVSALSGNDRAKWLQTVPHAAFPACRSPRETDPCSSVNERMNESDLSIIMSYSHPSRQSISQSILIINPSPHSA